MTSVLMLVHGMGIHGTGWATEVISDLMTAAEPYGLDGDFSDTLEEDGVSVVPVHYDERFDLWRNKWGEDSRELSRFITRNAIAVPSNIVSWLETADETENAFLWSHVVDVLLYRFFSLVTTDVRVHLARDIARCWRDALKLDPNAEVSVLAHSLGTSVAHDTLALLATDPPSKATGFLAGDRRLANVFMLANVSRILETSPRAYESVICPPSVLGSRAYCANLVNIRHVLDPVPAPRAFAPAWGGSDFLQIRTHAVRDFDVHGFGHYLSDPRVHIPIFRALFGFDAIDEGTAADAIEAYDEARGSTCPERLAAFVQDCRQRVQLIEDSSDVKTLLTAAVQFLSDVDELKTVCEDGP